MTTRQIFSMARPLPAPPDYPLVPAPPHHAPPPTRTTPFRPQVENTHAPPAPRPAPQVISNFAFGHSLGISGWAAASVVFATLFYRVYRSQLMVNAEK